MKQIVIKKIHMENFKKFKEQTIEFGEKATSVFGQNYRGKSSVADAFSWVMFNKSSTGNTEGSQFRPRRYDENGVNIDHVDVVVEMLLLVDGNEVKIRKAQSQKWVRHHGEDFDSYTGDETKYEWNDVPVTATEHKKKVAEIISEEVFRMISNPASFPALKAKEQREFLLKNVANITDDDVFAAHSEFEAVRTAMGSNTLEELSAKNKKAMKEYAEKQKEIPVRIDQESKRIDDIDFSEKEKELEKLQADLADNETKIEDTGKAYERLNELKLEKARFDSELVQIKRSVEEEETEKKREIHLKCDAASNEFNSLHEKQKTLEATVETDKMRLNSLETEIANTREKYKAEMAKELDEREYICPTCGQEIPEEQRETIKAEFEQNKASQLQILNEKGTLISKQIGEAKEAMNKRLEEIEDIKTKKVEAMAIKNNTMQELTEFENAPTDLINNKDYLYAKEQIEKLETEIASIDTSDADTLKDKLKEERATIQASIDKVKEELALKTVIEKSKKTIEELKAEMVEVTQSLANCEQLESAIDKFNKAKMDMLSERINGKFKVVKWKLFELQKNQKYAEVCVCMINGSCYGENTTSATERMMAGMDIINTLQDIYEVKAPIFLDDADLYNDWNIPAMDCQLIKLCVSEDEELVIKHE